MKEEELSPGSYSRRLFTQQGSSLRTQQQATTSSQTWGKLAYQLLCVTRLRSCGRGHLRRFSRDVVEVSIAVAAVKPEVWELDVSFATTEGSSCGQIRITRRVIWVTSGRSPSQELPTPRGSF